MFPAGTADAAFLRAILARPDDDAPRLIWADYLDESDAPADRARADLVRAQCALARLPADHPARPGLAAREADLLATHATEWAAPLDGLAAAVEFRRGLPDSVTVDARTFCRRGGELFARAPVRRVRVAGGGFAAELARCPHLEHVRELDLAGADLGNAGVAAVAGSPYLTELERLELAFTGAADGAAHALARGDFRRLVALGLGGNQAVTDAGVQALAAAPWFARLTALDLSDNLVGPAGVNALAAARLDALKLFSNPLGDVGVATLVTSPLYARLVSADPALDLSRVDAGPAAVDALSAAPASAGLVSLTLTGNPLGDAGIVALTAGHFDRLARLTVAAAAVTDRGAKRLAASHLMRGLDWLDLTGNRLTQSGVDALWHHRKDYRTVIDTAGNFAAPVNPAGLADAVGRVLSRVAAGAAPGGYTGTSPTRSTPR